MSKNRKTDRGAYVLRELIESPAFVALRGKAPHVLLAFYTKRMLNHQKNRQDGDKGWVIVNNGKLEFTYAEAKRRGFSRGQFERAVDELIAKGFLEIARPGGGVHKEKTLYALGEQWRFYGTANFKPKARPKNPSKPGFKKGNKLWLRKKTPCAQTSMEPCA